MKIAIQGHSIRFKEVIDTLANLGGINEYDYEGNDSSIYYYIDEFNHIMGQFKSAINTNLHKLYTLEEFEKEFPFKIGDKVVFKKATNNPRIYTVSELVYYDNQFLYKLKDIPYHYLPSVLKLHTSMKERNITLTLDKAKEWYNKGGELKEIALQAYTKEELNPLPKSWEEFCKMHPVTPEKYIFLSGCPQKYIAIWKLEQLRDCYRQGWTPMPKEAVYAIKYSVKNLNVYYYGIQEFLSFQSREVAEEFLKNFESLIKEAGDLI